MGAGSVKKLVVWYSDMLDWNGCYEICTITKSLMNHDHYYKKFLRNVSSPR